jgi:hypothetical protein
MADVAPALTATPVVPAGETSGTQHAEPTTGPIVVNYKFTKEEGSVNLTVNPDGTWLFSVDYKGKKPGYDIDVALALRSTLGGIIVWHYAGDASNGVQSSQQGKSDVLKDNFKTFAGKHDWSVKYDFALSAEGRAKRFEAQEKKKAELQKAEEEARKRHDHKVAAEKKAELAKEEQKEREAAQRAAAAHKSGGSSVMSTIGTVVKDVGTAAGVVGTILSFL